MLIRLATRTSKKTLATALGIALCVMVLSGSISLLDGLQSSTARVADRLDEGPMLVYSTVPLEDSRIDQALLDDLGDSYSALRTVKVSISYGGIPLQDTIVVSVSNATFLEASLAGLGDGEIWVGGALLASAQEKNVTLPQGSFLNVTSIHTSLALKYERVHPSTLLPDEWALATEETLKLLDPSLEEDASFLLVNEDSADLPKLRDAGLRVLPTAASVDFFRQGVNSLQPVLWGLAIAVGSIIVVLTFTLSALEVRYRSAEMRTLRQIGASLRFLLGLVLLQSLYVAAIGTILGLSLGSIVTNAVVSIAPLGGMATFVLPAPSIAGLAIPAVVALIAGAIGGFVPAWSAAKRTIAKGVPSRS